ncbi:60S ribosomal protein L36-2-like protein [Tanacetum coccineum]
MKRITDLVGSLGSKRNNTKSCGSEAAMLTMAPKQPNAGLFVGLNKGHIVTKKELAPCPSDMKVKTSKRVHSVRSLIREVVGFSLYERRITKLLKVGKDKRMVDKPSRANQQRRKDGRVAATTETKILFSVNVKHGGKDDKFYETFKGANINVQV